MRTSPFPAWIDHERAPRIRSSRPELARLMLPSSIAVGLFMGYFLDKLLGTEPWLLIVSRFRSGLRLPQPVSRLKKLGVRERLGGKR